MQAFVPKNRRPKFDLHLKIIDLNNVPYVTGKSFVKWHIPYSASKDHNGRSEKISIKEHKVIYDYETHVQVRLVIDKSGMLQESWIHFEVQHEVQSGGKGERNELGTVRLNLAEYVEASEQEGEDGVCRRYLMQESKINSTLKISLFMRQIDGDRNFITPPLRTAPVFTGIAGIMAGEEGDSEETGNMPAVTSKSREAGDELRELYRKTLAAEWTCQPGELSADKCIEDIFAGGDGWGKEGGHLEANAESGNHVSGQEQGALRSTVGGDARHYQRPKNNNWSSVFRKDLMRTSREGVGKRNDTSTAGVRGRSSFEHQASQMKDDADRGHGRPAREMDELELRQDLRSWVIPS